MKNHYDILLTKVFLIIASVTGISTGLLQEADLILGIMLKIISIISFIIVIGLNLPKLIRLLKVLIKR